MSFVTTYILGLARHVSIKRVIASCGIVAVCFVVSLLSSLMAEDMLNAPFYPPAQVTTNDGGADASITNRTSLNIDDLKQLFRITDNKFILVKDNRRLRQPCESLPDHDHTLGRRILLVYAQGCCNRQRFSLCRSALTTGIFDICVVLDQSNLPEDFVEDNANLLARDPGAGLWSWKAVLGWLAAIGLRSSDFVMYVDRDAVSFRTIDPIPCMVADTRIAPRQVAFFHSPNWMEYKYTKADSYFLMDCPYERCSNTSQVLGGIWAFYPSHAVARIYSMWMTYNQDIRIIGNEASSLNKEHPGFHLHRNDQTILSLILTKLKYPKWLSILHGIGNMFSPSEYKEFYGTDEPFFVSYNSKIKKKGKH